MWNMRSTKTYKFTSKLCVLSIGRYELLRPKTKCITNSKSVDIGIGAVKRSALRFGAYAPLQAPTHLQKFRSARSIAPRSEALRKYLTTNKKTTGILILEKFYKLRSVFLQFWSALRSTLPRSGAPATFNNFAPLRSTSEWSMTIVTALIPKRIILKA